MKRLLQLAVMCCLLLTACGGATQKPPLSETTLPTEPETAAEPQTTTEQEETTIAEHSPMYIYGVSTEDVILYFKEVCLDAELPGDGNPAVVQKWNTPIYCILVGQLTPDDQLALDGFLTWLNSVEGFPGIEITTDPNQANMRMYFCPQNEIPVIMGDSFSDVDGVVTIWYDQNVIYDAQICISTDSDQHLRTSVILEELYNGLGPMQDSDLRADSIIYSGYSEPQEMTAIDHLLLELLYHPDMHCGMSADECADVIRQLYY